MPTVPPAQCVVALKEWATVLEALGRGDQVVLIRKGGLIEPGAGFEVRHDAFLFYPTFEHQAVRYVRAADQASFEEALRRRAPEGRVRFDLAGVAVRAGTTSDPNLLSRLGKTHIYQDAFLTQRLKWQPDQPLTVVLVRVYRLAAPAVVPVAPTYAGCTSWVELETPVSLAGATPVLDEAAFQARAAPVARVLG